jgi:tryptophanyl-tRNA synthetase
MNNKSKKVILSGLRPTGEIHLGNLLGALENWVKLQNSHKCFFMAADLHALSTDYKDTSSIKENIINNVIDWLAAGIDPEKCTIFIQSRIAEHTQLYTLLSMITPLPWLERNPTYKEQIQELKDKDISTLGFLGYPVLQAADILLYKAELVPVGEDQLPHLELTREITRRFNHLYGQTFPEPQPLLTKMQRLLGFDNRKMSKSYKNYIALRDDEKIIRKKTSSMITDPQRKRLQDPGRPNLCNVYSYHKHFNSEKTADISEKCKTAKIGCTECKKILADALVKYLGPVSEKSKTLQQNLSYIEDVLEQGTKEAQKTASNTFKEAMEKIKI